ncbi:hypothetical protein TNCV_81801 [Trichonephila clavipes]|nr:hypothetical protein TNCV_81801 [Trichonephila clavipes]
MSDWEVGGAKRYCKLPSNPLPGGFEGEAEGNDLDGRCNERRDIRTQEKRLRTQERQTHIATAVITL